jgi:uncharacterized phage protein (TIGR02220 family)
MMPSRMSQLYARVFTQILDSSIAEDFETRHVFEDFLKVCSTGKHGGVVDMTRAALARKFNFPIERLNRAIERLEAPDPQSRNQDHDGRRIERLDSHRDWGWQILNWHEYEQIRNRADVAERVARHRKAKDVPQNVPQGTPPDGTELKAPKVSRFHPDAKAVLAALNSHSGRVFRETDGNMGIISARLREGGVTLVGVEQMIIRQCELWGADPKMAEYLRPETLFAKSKFDGYYAGRELSVGNQKRQEFSDRPETVDIPMLDFGQPLAKPNPYEQRPPKIH